MIPLNGSEKQKAAHGEVGGFFEKEPDYLILVSL
jgi:hypothetical protein